VQKLSGLALSSADLSFISRIPLDLATPSTLISFFIDQGLINAAVLVDDCSKLQPAASGLPGNDTGFSGDGILGPIGSVCIKGLTAKEQTVAALERQLFCQSASDTVRPAAFLCTCTVAELNHSSYFFDLLSSLSHLKSPQQQNSFPMLLIQTSALYALLLCFRHTQNTKATSATTSPRKQSAITTHACLVNHQ
jgi:hypothetical protein